MSTKNFSANNTLFSKERIETVIGDVKQAKDATKPSGKERTLLKQYDILTVGNLEKLIKRKTYDDIDLNAKFDQSLTGKKYRSGWPRRTVST
jgi:hypothetical protein